MEQTVYMPVWVFGGFGLKTGIDMNYKYVKPVKSAKLLDDYKDLTGYELPKDFRNFVIEFNGGRPERKGFSTSTGESRELKSFLSFNPDDKETVWKVYEAFEDKLKQKYLPFAIDNFGNYICFNTENNNIVFLNHEDLSVEYVADTFVSLLNLLYE